MKYIYIMLIFCLFLSACQSRKVEVLSAVTNLHNNSLAAAIKAKEISCDVRLTEKISKGEWRLKFAFFKEGKLINEKDFDPSMFGGYIGVPISFQNQGKRSFLPDDKVKFNNIKIKLFFIDLEYVNLNENAINKKSYKVYLSVDTGELGFSDTIILPKSVANLSGVDIGTFPTNFKYPDKIIPLFYLREMNLWEEKEITEKSLPSPKNDLNSFIEAKYPDTLIICFLVRNLDNYLNFLGKYFTKYP